MTSPAMRGRTLGGCWGLSLTLKSFCVSEWSIKGSARCTLLPDVLSSSELLSCLSHYTELLTEVQSNTLRVQWQKAFLGSSCTQSMPHFSDPLVLVSVLVSQSGDAVRTLFSPPSVYLVQTGMFLLWVTHQLPGEPVFPISEEHRCVCSAWKCSQRALQYFHPWPLAFVFITSMTSAGADAFKNPECFIYWGFM